VPILTSLEMEPRSGGVRLRLDNEPYATVGAADIAALRLKVGGAVDARQLAALAYAAELFGAGVVAQRLLAMRALPSAELVRRLVRRGHGREVSEAAVRRLVQSGLVNDAEFARHYARTRSRRRRLGPVRLRRELQRFGIASEAADAAVRDALDADGVDVRALLEEAAARKLRTLAGCDPARARRSLRTYLLRRGFAPADVVAYLKTHRVA
jgi:regulatory protein